MYIYVGGGQGHDLCGETSAVFFPPAQRAEASEQEKKEKNTLSSGVELRHAPYQLVSAV